MATIKNLAAEFIGTFALIFGLTITMDILISGPITGASMNPARSIAPAIISGHLEYLALYVIAPIIGMILAVPLYKLRRHPSN